MKSLAEIFITEPGRGATARIKLKAGAEAIAALRPGDEVLLKGEKSVLGKGSVAVCLPDGKTIGEIEGETADKTKGQGGSIRAFVLRKSENSLQIFLRSETSLFPVKWETAASRTELPETDDGDV